MPWSRRRRGRSEDVRVLWVSGTKASNTLRYRVRFAEEALRRRGLRTAAVYYRDPAVLDWVRSADVLALYRVPLVPKVVEAVRRAREERDIPVTYDIDDLVFTKEHLQSIAFLRDLPDKVRTNFEREVIDRAPAIRLSDRASGSTQVIATELEQLAPGPVEVLPNGLSIGGAAAAAAVQPRESDGRIRLGYFSGSATHEKDWEVVEPAVLEMLGRYPQTELWLVGKVVGGPALSRFESRIRRVPPVDWRELPRLIAEVDINLAPLEDVSFTRGKSALKWLEAAVVRVPTIASPTPPFREVVRDGETGMLAEDASAWATAIEELLADSGRRRAMGAAARVQALEEFSPDRQADRYQAFFHRALNSPRAERPSAQRSTRLEAFDFPPGLKERTFSPPEVADLKA